MKTIRFILFTLLAFIVATIAALVAFFVRNMVRPPQQALWTTPAERGLAYEDVQFTARDGVRLSGWFMPAIDQHKRQGATVVIAHGWLANRIGGQGKTTLARWGGVRGMNVLPLVQGLHEAGFHVLVFDQRNHGESAAAPPVTFGKNESQDLLGALDYVTGRAEVSVDRLCVIGISMGANALVYTLPQTEQICAAVAAQPVTISLFHEKFGRTILGPFAPLMSWLVDKSYQAAGGSAIKSLQPAKAVAQSTHHTPVLYIQGTGDDWGSVADVEAMAAVTPGADGVLVVETNDRIEGYEFAIDNPQLLIEFFERHLPN